MILKSPRYAFIVAILICLNLFGQPDKADTEKQFSVSALQQDIVTLRCHYEKNLANLYLYTPKNELDSLFNSLYGALSPMTERQFYSYITPLLSVIKDGHSIILPGNETINRHLQHSKYFPFQVYWHSGHLYTTMNFSGDTSIKDGTEVLAINEEKTNEIWSYLMARQVRDGFNETYPRWILNHYFRSYYNMNYGYPELYRLKIKTPDGNIENRIVPGVTQADISLYKKYSYKNRISNTPSKGISFNITDSVAILTIKTWDNKSLRTIYKQNFKKEISGIFKSLQQHNCSNLIIDLRDNQGGTSANGDYLLSYLLNQPYQYTVGVYKVAAHTDTGQCLKKLKAAFVAVHQPNPNCFKGKLLVLINGGSFSNSGIFCSNLQQNGRGSFIGEETGGNATVLTGVFGTSNKTTLPNTGLICDKANHRIVITNTVSNSSHGVLPDITVIPSVNDIISNLDVVIPKALETFKTNK